MVSIMDLFNELNSLLQVEDHQFIIIKHVKVFINKMVIHQNLLLLLKIDFNLIIPMVNNYHMICLISNCLYIYSFNYTLNINYKILK